MTPPANGGLRQAHRRHVAFAHRVTGDYRRAGALFRDLLPSGPRRLATWHDDWQTVKPYAFDVAHSDGFIVIDPRLHERFAAAGLVSGATVPEPLRRLLDVHRRLRLEASGWLDGHQAFDSTDWVLE